MLVPTPARTAPAGTGSHGFAAAFGGPGLVVADDAAAAGGRQPAGRRFTGQGWLRLISPVVAVGLWQAASSTGLLPASKLGSPASIVHTAYNLIVADSPTYGTLQSSLLVSCERWAMGFAAGVVAGVFLGVISGLSRAGETILDPIMQALRSVPLLGLIPLFIVWFGIGELPKVLFVTLAATFLMYIETFAGIRNVDRKLAEVGHVLGLRRSEMLRHIVLPGALPQVLTGLRLSLVASLLALVVGEQINASAGLGFMITQAEQFLQTSVIMVALIVYAILGLLADALVRLL
ncbi:MAG: ABC transporter permease, partial [Streptosporangiaceae bacterium]|nr:ABC transporter permease [Streptosporangiaceae bacterium]